MSIRKWPEKERPREKLLRQGVEALTDAELLAIFLRVGVAGVSAVSLARQLLINFGSIRALLTAEQFDFCQIKGLGQAKYTQLQAALELSRRFLAEQLAKDAILTSPKATRRYLIAKLRDEPNEHFCVLMLDAQHKVIRFKLLFKGTVNQATIYPRVLIKEVLRYNAAAVILAHNHPSGEPEPSKEDRDITNKLVAALALIDVPVVDHFVIGDGHAVSFAERGWIKLC